MFVCVCVCVCVSEIIKQCVYIVFNSTDTFSLTCPELGEVNRIHIRHDNRGDAPGWYLIKV